MPDDPIQSDEPTQDTSTEIKPEEIKPVGENPQPEEQATPEPPKEETPIETPKAEESKPEERPAEESKPEEPKQSEEKKPEESKPSEPGIKIVEKEVIKEVKVVDEAELGKQLDEKFKEKLLENKKKADNARSQNRKDHLDRIIALARKKQINNQDVRDLLQVSQSTATTYLTELAKSGRLKAEGKAKAKVYRS